MAVYVCIQLTLVIRVRDIRMYVKIRILPNSNILIEGSVYSLCLGTSDSPN